MLDELFLSEYSEYREEYVKLYCIKSAIYCFAGRLKQAKDALEHTTKFAATLSYVPSSELRYILDSAKEKISSVELGQ